MRNMWGSIRGLLVAAAAAVLVVAVASPGLAASPSSGSVGPSNSSASWSGAYYTLAAGSQLLGLRRIAV
ncbi:MAG: hypothetical protein M3Q23_04850 [Actinomycetota bacterium]|nr:hypothetical protein [Actinomycetota bacterium]